METSERTDAERIEEYEEAVRLAFEEAKSLHERMCDLFLLGLDLQNECREPGDVVRAYEIAKHVGTAQRSMSVTVDCLIDARC